MRIFFLVYYMYNTYTEKEISYYLNICRARDNCFIIYFTIYMQIKITGLLYNYWSHNKKIEEEQISNA